MKKAVFILLVFVGIVFRITADNQGAQDKAKNADQQQTAAVQTDIPANDKTPSGKETDKDTGGNIPQPQVNASDPAEQKSPTGTPPAHPKSDDGINSPVDPQTPVDSTPNAVDTEAKEQATAHNTENDSAYYLSTTIESARRLAEDAEEHSKKALSELKQYGRYWDEQYNRMSIFIKIFICFALLSILVIVIIGCILFALMKKMSELEKAFPQQINRFPKDDNQVKDTQYRQRNSISNEVIQEDTAHHRLNDRGYQDRSFQAAVKTDIGKKQTTIGQNPKMETVRPKSTGCAEQSNDNLPALYFSEAERKKWFSSSPTYSCLNVPDHIRNGAYRGEAISSTEIALTQSGNINNALFILLDDKYVYLNFRLYNAERELPADIERIVKLVYDFDQPLPRYVKTCQPALVRKTNDGYTIQQKGKIWLA